MTHPLMNNGRQDATRIINHHQMINGRHDPAAAAADAAAAAAVAVASFAKHETLFLYIIKILFRYYRWSKTIVGQVDLTAKLCLSFCLKLQSVNPLISM